MTQYYIVVGTDHIELESKVNDFLNQGFICIGGVCANGGSLSAEYFYQAVVKIKD